MGFLAKSFCSLHTKKVVGFCTHQGGLTQTRAELASAGGHLESEVALQTQLFSTLMRYCSGCQKYWETGRRRADLKCALRSSHERCQSSLIYSTWEAAPQ